MKLTTQIQEGLLNLFNSKLRSVLALLGILVGTASVVAMVMGGQIATNEALKQFKTLGTDLLAVTISESPNPDGASGSQENISLEQVNEISVLNRSILRAAPYTQVYSPIQFAGNDLNSSILGVTEDFQKIVHLQLIRGRFVSILDGYAFYCVIGNNVYEEIHRHTFLNPIGQQIQIGKNYFTIIGIAKPWPENSFVYANIDNSIMIPILASSAISKFSSISNIIIQISPDADIDKIKNKMEQYINSHVSNKNIFFRSPKELIEKMAKQSQILTVFLGLIGGISLLVGGIGVMNIMLVSVVERRREIGIRLAVGATRKNIRTLFLIEATMLSFVGGVIGVLLGILIAFLISIFWHWQFNLFLLPPLIGFSVSTATGIFFGYYPAYRASKLDPIEALRSD